MLLVFVSTVIAFFLALGMLPVFNDLTGKQLSLPVSEPVFWLALLVLILVTGFVAGTYPALYLSSLNATKVLKGRLRFGWPVIFFRKALVVFQFALSLILIVATIIIYRQMKYVHSANLGYDRDNLVYIPIEGELIKNYTLFKEQALKVPGVLNISKMRNSPTIIEHHTGSIEWPGKNPNLNVSFADAVVGYDFVKTLDIKLTQGRDFAQSFGTDSASYLLNETAVQKIGFTDPVGKTVFWGNRRGTVIGVLKDFHFHSMHHTIEPLIVRLDEKWGWGTILVRIQAGKISEAIASIQNICKTINPKVPFTYQFSDQEYSRLYASEQVVSKLSNYFAFLAIFISCLGLFGLAAFTAEQRTKEIGVRKVLGASGTDIVALLSAHFLKPVSIAMLIGFPIAWYLVNKWLEDFAYKTSIEWWIFGLAGMLTIVIALLTVTFQSIKAALVNPVKSLRTE